MTWPTLESVLDELKVLEVQYWRLADKLQAAYEAELFISYKCKFPKKGKLNWWEARDAIPDEEATAILNRWKPRADRIIKYRKARANRLDKISVRLARDYGVVRARKRWETFSEHWVSTYRTQGYGAEKYAQGEAENQASKIRYHSIPAKVRYIADDNPRFVVEVKTDSFGVQVLRLKPGVPLREWLAQCWRQGTNPRVYNPFLPHGLEERLGIGYYGDFLVDK